MRVPLPTDFVARLSSAFLDARMVNGLKEGKESGAVVLNRPGLVDTGYDYVSGQGMVGLNGLLYLVYDDKFELGGLLWLPWWSYSTGDVVSYNGALWSYSGASVGQAPGTGGWVAYVPSVPGWVIVGSSLPVDISYYLAYALSTSSGIALLTGATQKSYLSSDGATWSGSTSWTGIGSYLGVAQGWSDGTTMWHCFCLNPDLYVEKTTYSAFSMVAGTRTISGGLLSDYDEPELYKIGTTLFARVADSGTVAQFVTSSDSSLSWSTVTSDLPHADFSYIVVMGSTAYSIPPGSGSGKKVYSSTDFAAWTLLTSDWGLGTETPACVAKQDYGSKIVVLLSSDNVATSTDGSSWAVSSYSSHPIPPAFVPKALCQLSGDWYALGDTSWAKLDASKVP